MVSQDTVLHLSLGIFHSSKDKQYNDGKETDSVTYEVDPSNATWTDLVALVWDNKGAGCEYISDHAIIVPTRN